ncbi:type II toxin-antitoxin system VapC family toxin [archaeon]|nr:type II toxin-antitoxin system VapC family toxin [archaeon]
MLLDTTILIDFLRNKNAAVQFFEKNRTKLLFTTEINIFELVVGIYAHNKDIDKHLEKVFLLADRLTILHLNRNGTLKAGEIAGKLISKGEKIENSDYLIAGISLSHGVNTIVTENKKHYERIPEIKLVTY